VTSIARVRPGRSGDEHALLEVVHAAFAEYEGRLVPPSGAHVASRCFQRGGVARMLVDVADFLWMQRLLP
jgi:hypothetical protein